MKGIMVPLLMLWMTGIVVGQQSSSSVFPTAGFQPNPQNNAPGPGNFPRIDPGDVKPMNLSVTDEQIAGIRNGKVLDSRIDPRSPIGNPLPLQVVSGITLAYVNNQDAELAARRLVGKNVGDGKLSIELDDWALADLKTKKLVYEIPESDRGKYDLVTFYYNAKTQSAVTGSGSQLGNRPFGPSPDDSFGFSQVPFGPPNRNALGQLVYPGAEPFSGGADRRGTANSVQTPNVNRPKSWQPLTVPPTNPNSRNAIANQPNRGSSMSVWDNNRNNQPFESAAETNQRLLQAKLEADEQRRRQLASNRAFNMPGNPAGGASSRSLGANNAGALQPPLTNQQIADRRAILEKQQQLKTQADDLASREAALALQQLQFENQRIRESLKSRDENITPRIPNGPIGGRTSPSGSPNSSLPDRWASLGADDVIKPPLMNPAAVDRQRNVSDLSPAPTSGISKLDMRIRAENASTGDTPPAFSGKNPVNPSDAQSKLEERKVKRTEGFIYFMLLCSLGLNVYLGLISRGFYVRYNELADELRETFTATM